jgi:hypothetical protein
MIKATYVDSMGDERLRRMIEYTVKVSDTGDKYWWINGKLHREDGPAIEYADGHKYWYLKGKLHREDGPAIEYADGHKEWYLKDKLHREDGPAIESANGYKYWCLNGKKLTEDEWKDKVSKPNCEGKEVEIDGVTYVLKMKG